MGTENEDVSKEERQLGRRIRTAAATSVALLVLIYTAGVLKGFFTVERKIDAAHVALIVVAAASSLLLLAPELLPEVLVRLKSIKIQGVSFEMFKKVESGQEKQGAQLDDITLLLSLLLPKREQSHLYNLAQGVTQYDYRDSVDGELDHLISLGVIQLLPNRKIGGIPHNAAHFNLAEFVELTKLGRRWVERLIEIKRLSEGKNEDA